MPKRSSSPVPPVGDKAKSNAGSRVVGVTGLPKSVGGIVGDVGDFLGVYLALSPRTLLVSATWDVAAHLADLWDRFPHKAITSPEKRCGKTRSLQLDALLLPNPYHTTNISPAVLYRLIGAKAPTLLLDEAQSMERRGSESSEVLRELFNAGIDRESKVLRCGGANMDEIHEFPIYCPKVIALIGELDSVLADRCLPIQMKRKTDADNVQSYRSRLVEPRGKELAEKIAAWAEENRETVADIYDHLEPFPIQNDRMAELLLPLQAVLTLSSPHSLPELEAYAFDLQRTEAENYNKSPGVMLLNACREIFAASASQFIGTEGLLAELHNRKEERWGTWNKGTPLSAEALARILRPYGVKPSKQQVKLGKTNLTTRGYYATDFTEAFDRYLPHTL